MDKIFSPIKGRIIQFIDKKGIKKEDFFKKTGISPSNFKGKGAESEIGGDKMVSILTKYDDLNPEWLLLGKGEMFNLQTSSQLQDEEATSHKLKSEMIKNVNQPNQTMETKENDEDLLITRNPLIKGYKRKGMNKIEYYDVDFAAGRGLDVLDTGIPTYEMDIPGFAGCKAFNIYGDSMEGLIKGGSIVFGRKIEDWMSYLEYGQVYGVVMEDGRRFLKYIRKAEDSKNCFLLRSENKEYDDFEIPKDKIHNIWLIEGWMLKRT